MKGWNIKEGRKKQKEINQGRISRKNTGREEGYQGRIPRKGTQVPRKGTKNKGRKTKEGTGKEGRKEGRMATFPAGMKRRDPSGGRRQKKVAWKEVRK